MSIYYDINGVDVYNSSTYLFENENYTVNYIYYKGMRVPLNYQFVARVPETVKLEAPLYNVQISAVSAFGTPVNASINMTFDNGTQLNSYLGESGTLNFTNVPYGHMYGYVEYLGIKKSVILSGAA